MRLSVFFPAYNEEANIEKVVRKALAVLEGLSLDDYEVTIVNDGSTDKTEEIAKKLALENSRVRVISHFPNRGYGAALKTGLENAHFEWIAFMDGDGQFDFSEITKFLKKANEADLIIGYRLKRADSLIRRINARLWSFLLFLLFNLKVKDRACGFKLIKRKVVESIPQLELEGAVAEDELLIKAKRGGFRFAEVGVYHYPRLGGKQTGANPRVILKAFLELDKLWRRLR